LDTETVPEACIRFSLSCISL